jgi:2'-hydroxyisoflavone reductase
MPLWIPASDQESAGFMHFACARAVEHGLALRPLAETVDDTAAWLRERDHSDAWRNVLSAEKEREILACILPPQSASPLAAPGVRS